MMNDGTSNTAEIEHNLTQSRTHTYRPRTSVSVIVKYALIITIA